MNARTTAPLIALVLALGCAAPCAAWSSPERAAVVQWAKESLAPLSTVKPGHPWEDLDSLGRMIGDATVVALSEAVHVGAEPLEFRNRVFEYLVEQKGFTAIAIESGIVEGRIVHDYVRGGPGDLPAVLAEGISWTFDRLPQNRDLVTWLRQYNADPRHARKINFYGFDVPGSPGNPQANCGVQTALIDVLKYMVRVDNAAAGGFRARLDPLLKNLRFDLQRPADAPGYDRLSGAERDELTAAIADLIILLERREAAYTAASSADDYEWAYRTAIGARQVDNWLRQIPPGWQPAREKVDIRNEQHKFFSIATDSRDRAQADNLDWILRREGAAGKVLVYASRYHLSATPVITGWGWSTGRGHNRQEVAGTYLRRRLGDRLVSIGNLIGKGAYGCAGFNGTWEQAPPESMDGLAGEAGVPLFLLDLRNAPASVRQWLNREHTLGVGDDAFKMTAGRAFDVLLYFDTVTPACSF